MDNGIFDNRRRQRIKCRKVLPSWKLRRQAGIKIPTLCYLKGVNAIGACRHLRGGDRGRRGAGRRPAFYPVSEGMEVKTNTPQVQQGPQAELGAAAFQP